MNILTYVQQKVNFFSQTKGEKGFTLIELLVVMAIIVIITSVTLANYSAFGSQIILRNLAYNVALSVRQAQVFGIASKSFQGKFSQGHGIYINLSASDTNFTLYTDVYKDNFFTLSPVAEKKAEEIKVFTIGRGFKIGKICVPVAGVENCSVTKLDIIFKRPQPDAIIRAVIGVASFKPYATARIVIVSPDGRERSVFIGTAGQISVRK